MSRRIFFTLVLLAALSLLATLHGDWRVRGETGAQSPLLDGPGAQAGSPLAPASGLAPQSPLRAPDGLDGTRWRLSRYLADDGEMAAAATDVGAFIAFLDGAVTGHSGCSSFVGAYQADIDAGALSFGEMGADAAACPSAFAAQEQGLLAALASTETFELRAGDGAAQKQPALTLYDRFGRAVAEFDATSPPALVGPLWTATGYRDANAAFAPIIPGSEITAQFEIEGTLHGNAGCNNYRVRYYTAIPPAVNASSPAALAAESPLFVPGAGPAGDTPIRIGSVTPIRIGRVVVTRMGCTRPDGVMQQEQDYLAALPAAAQYRLGMESLELLDADGVPVAAFAQPQVSGDAGLCNAAKLGSLTLDLDLVDAPVDLQDGVYEDETGGVRVELHSDSIACSDVTGDGKDDALALLSAHTGGTGVFVYLAVISMDPAYADTGRPAAIASVLLGDRVRVHSVSVGPATGQHGDPGAPVVTVEMIAQGPDDPMCCPTQHVVSHYQLLDGDLQEMDRDVMQGLTYVKLANMAYDIPETESGVAFLDRGLYVEPSSPESSLLPLVTLLPDSVAFGEIDAAPSAAAVLMAQPGTGTFYRLALVQEIDGSPVHVAGALLGDRIVLNSVRIEEDEILVDMVTQGPDDPECCPATRVINAYALQDGELSLQSSVERSRRDELETELVGPVWQWQGSQYNDDTEAAPDDAARYTLQFAADGRVAAQADCNRANGRYAVEQDALDVELHAVTRSACPSGSLAEEFLRDVNGVRLHFFRDGDLYLDIQADAGTMHFRAAP